MSVDMSLALGTVQFGLTYGIAGRGEPVPPSEVRDILRCASDLGITVLDSASAYGDIESRLRGLADSHYFRVVTKVPAVPPELTGSAVGAWVSSILERSAERLGDMLDAVMLHHAEDLLGDRGESIWQACEDFVATRGGLRLGVSCYDPSMLDKLCETYPIAVAQVPGNAFDQRLCSDAAESRTQVEIHVRSAFLQGLLLMPAHLASHHGAHTDLIRWHRWCAARQLTPLEAALGCVKALPGVRHCVVGVDRVEQLQEIAEVWTRASPIFAPELRVDDPDVIDPRRWRAM